MQGDLIAQGAMLNKYQPTMSIFVLKNWCKWADKPENENEEKQEMQTELLKAIKKAVTDEDCEDIQKAKRDIKVCLFGRRNAYL